MITDDDVFALFERADPARTKDDGSIDVVGDLDALRTRSNNVTYIEPTPTTTEPPENRRLLFFAAAAAVAALVVAGLVLVARDDEPASQTPAATPETAPATAPTSLPNTPATSPPTTPETSPPAPSAADAIEQATTFLASFEMRDMPAVEEQLAEGFATQLAFTREPLEQVSLVDSLGLFRQVATAVNYVDPICSVIDESPAGTVVECLTVMELVYHQSTNDAGVPTTVTITVNGDGVVGMDSRYSANFGSSDVEPFNEWFDANRPGEAEPVEAPQTFADFELNAQWESALLDDWIAFGLDAVQATYADLNDGNVDAFLARFPGRDVLGVPAGIAREAWSGAVADSNRHESSNCGPAGMEQGVLVIACDVTISRGQLDLAGVQIAGRERLGIGPDGLVAWSDGTMDFEPMHELNRAFEAWMAQNLPDVHAQITWIDLGSPAATHEDQTVLDTSFAEFVAASDVYPRGG